MKPPADALTATPAVDPADPAASGGLRVAVFSDAIPGRNGVGTYYDDLVRHLDDHVERVVMVTPPRDERDGMHLKSMSMPGDPTQRLYWPPVREIFREMEALAPHVVVSATPGAYGSLGMLVASRRDAGFCVGYHTQVDELARLYWRRSLGPVLRRVLGLWDRVMFRRAECVLVLNQELLRTVLREGVRHARLVGTPTPKPFLAEPLPPLPPGIRTVVFIGRLAPEKRLQQVEEAARAFPRLQFRIAGDGPLRAEVEGWAAEHDNVEALGWVSRDDVREVLDDADLLVLPSRYETFGSIALEAMARRKVAVVSPSCGISRWPELAEGLVVMEDEERLADTLGRVLALPRSDLDALAIRGREAAVELNRRTIADWLAVCEAAARTGVR